MANGVHKYALDLVGTLFKRRIIAVSRFFNNREQLTRNYGKTGIYFTRHQFSTKLLKKCSKLRMGRM